VGVEVAGQVAVGYDIACARGEAGAVHCWRDWVDHDQGPPITKADAPARSPGFEGDATDIRTTDNRLCAVNDGGEGR
jgi:hypothetical protein